MKALDVSITFDNPNNYALFVVKYIVSRAEVHKISYLHHRYTIAREALGVKNYFYMWG